MRSFLRKLFNNRGENEQKTGNPGETQPAAGSSEKAEGADTKFTQADIDRIVQERISRERQKYSDYPDLMNKVKEYEKQKEQLSQQELEKKQEYEKLKEGWQQKENEYKTMLEKTKSEVQSERVNNVLNTEILKKSAYPEAAQLLRSMAKYNDDGTITIRGKDANGMETDLPVEQGVEQFLKERPYLVKGQGQGGAGTAPGQGGAGGQAPESDSSLGQQLQNAMAVGDRKQAQEIKNKIRAKHAAQGIKTIL